MSQEAHERLAPICIALGASAGGLEAIKTFLRELDAHQFQGAILVAQHLSPTYESHLTSILSHETSLTVREVQDGSPINRGCVYVTPPDTDVLVAHGCLNLVLTGSHPGPKPSIDRLFSTLGKAYGKRAIGIILSGTGRDGSDGAKTLVEAGGTLLVQRPDTARYDGMPLAAIGTDLAEAVLPTHELAQFVQARLAPDAYSIPEHPHVQASDSGIRPFLEEMGQMFEMDLTPYKASTLGTRIAHRIDQLGFEDLVQYRSYLEDHPAEWQVLFQQVFVGPSSAFQDERFFQLLKDRLRGLLERKSDGEVLRVWVPGCGTGQEAYSLAMLLHELKVAGGQQLRIQIFATDLQEDAVMQARSGIYHQQDLAGLPSHLLTTYFKPKGDRFEVIKEIRSLMLFSRHSLLQHPPFLNLDLISCRNLLMDFTTDMQRQLIPLLHYALRDKGYLITSPQDDLSAFDNLFQVIAPQAQLLLRRTDPPRKRKGQKQRSLSSFYPRSIVRPPSPRERADQVWHIFGAQLVQPHVLIDDNYEVLYLRGNVMPYLQLREGPMTGKLFQLCHPSISLNLRGLIQTSENTQTPQQARIKQLQIQDISYDLRIWVYPHSPADGSKLYLIIFDEWDRSPHTEPVELPSPESDQSSSDERSQELAWELAATREQLQTVIEALEVSNQDLQVLNEEMQSTNEELQSANEELATSNEELQSSHEEISIAYQELRAVHEDLMSKEQALVQSEHHLQTLLRNTAQGFLLLNEHYEVLTYNELANELWQMGTQQFLAQGQNLLAHLAEEEASSFIEHLRRDNQPYQQQWTWHFAKRDEGEIYLQLTLFTIGVPEGGDQMYSLGIQDISQQVANDRLMRENELLYRSISENFPNGTVTILDRDFRIRFIGGKDLELGSASAEQLFGQDARNFTDEEDREWIEQNLTKALQGEPRNFEHRISGSTYLVSAQPLPSAHGQIDRLLVVSQNITERKRTQALIQQQHQLLQGIQASVRDGIVAVDLDQRILSYNQAFQTLVDSLWSHQLSDDESYLFPEVWAESTVPDLLDQALQGSQESIICPVPSNTDVRFLDVSVYPMLAEKEVAGVVILLRDITDTRSLQAERERLFELSPDMIGTANSEGYFVTLNPAAETILGYRMDSLLSRPITSFLHSKDRGPDSETMQIRLKKKVFGLVNRYIRADGSTCWLSWNAVYSPEEKLFYFIARDVTKQKQEEERLRMIESVVAHARDGVIITNAYPYDPPGPNIIYANAAMTTISGYALSDMLGHTPRMFQGPETDRNTLDNLRQAISNDEIWEGELVNYHKDGSPYWVRLTVVPVPDEKGETQQFISMQRDVTAQRETEAKIRESEANLSALINNTKDVILSVDRNYHIITFNEQYQSIVKEIQGRVVRSGDYALLNTPESRRSLWQSLIDRAFAGNSFQEELTVDISGAPYIANVRFTPIRHEGSIIGCTIFSRDITDLKQAEQELIKAKDRAEEMTRLKSHFLASMSHEIRTPLNGIMGLLSLLHEEDNIDFIRDMLNRMSQSSERLLSTLTGILELANLEATQTEYALDEVSLNALLEDMMAFWSPSAQLKGISLERDATDQDAIVWADERMLTQIMNNLIGNAIKFTKEGEVRLALRTETKRKQHFAVIDITDTGIGIDPADQKRIFEAFSQASQGLRRKYEGTGIGLAIAKRYTELLGGSIKLKSKLGEGSTFSLFLPLMA